MSKITVKAKIQGKPIIFCQRQKKEYKTGKPNHINMIYLTNKYNRNKSLPVLSDLSS